MRLIIAPGQVALYVFLLFFFSIFFNMKVCCVFSLESPYRGDFNEYTQHTSIYMYIMKKILNITISAAIGMYTRDSRTSSN